MAFPDNLIALSAMLPQLQADQRAMQSLFDTLQSQSRSLKDQLAAGGGVTPAQLSQLERGIAQLVALHAGNQAILNPQPATAPTSGSIRFTNRALVRTDPGPLFAGQPAWGFSARIRISRRAPGGSWILWTDAGFSNQLVVSEDGSGRIQINMGSTGGGVSGSAGYAIGSAFHVAGSFSPGRQVLKFNGDTIASGTFQGTAYSQASQVFMGYSPQSPDPSGDAQVGDVNFWADYAPTDAEIIALRDRKVDPKDVGPTGPALRLSCIGTPGATVAPGDPGIKSSGSRTGTGFDVAGMSDPAGSTLTYADPLDYVVPVAVTAYVTKSGKWLACLATQKANVTPLGTSPPAIVAIGATPPMPTAAINGRPLTLYNQPSGDPWWDSDGNMPECYWQLCCGSIESTIIYDGGSGFARSGTKVSGIGGDPATPATYDAVVRDGVIKSIPVTASPPAFASAYGGGLTCAVTGGGGSGFRAVCLTGPTGALQSVRILDGGEGFTAPFSGKVTFTSLSGNPVDGIAIGPVVVADGVITGLTPTNAGGRDYTSLPALVASGNGTGFDAAPIMTGAAKSDTVTLTWPDGFLRTAIGASAGAEAAAVANYAGRDETIISTSYTIPGRGPVPWSLFGQATTTKMGTNLYGPHSMNIQPYYANWAHSVGLYPFAAAGGPTVPGMTADGWPTTLGDTGSAYSVIHDNEALYSAMGPDFRGAPLATGPYTFIWDDASPIDATTPQTIWEWLPQGRANPNVIITGPTVVSTGTMVGGVLKGITHSYHLSYRADPDTYNVSMCMYVTNTTFPASNLNTSVKGSLQLIPPGNPVPLPSDAAPDLGLVGQLAGCGMIRAMKTFPTEAGATFTADQITPLGDFSWGQRHIAPRINIAQIRRYDVGRSPWIYLRSCAGFDTPANRAAYATPADDPMHGIAAYRVPVSDPSFLWLATEHDWFVAEFVTQSPHGLWTGYLPHVDPANASMTIENGLPGTPGYQSVSMGVSWDVIVGCFVTGPTTLAVMVFNSTGLVPNGTAPGNANNVSATGGWTWPGSGPMPSILADVCVTVPPEALAGLANALPGCVAHVTIPLMLDDDGVAAYATRLRDTLDPGHDVYVEFGNENWNMFFYQSSQFGYQIGALLAHAGLLDGSHGANNGFCTQRGYEVTGIFRSAFDAVDAKGVSGRGPSVKWCLGSAWRASEEGTGVSTEIDYCLAHGLTPDVFTVANYQSVDDVGYIHNAASVTLAFHPASPAYGVARPMALAAYIDLLRHYFPMNLLDNGPYGSPQVGTYHSILAQVGRLSPSPALVAYEGGIQQVVNHDLSVYSTTPGVASDQFLPGKMTHDIVHHPASVDLISGSWGLGAQNGGMTNTDYFLVRAPRSGGGYWDGIGRTTWSISTWTGQLAGVGDGSDGLAVNRFCLFPSADGTPPDGRSHDADNVNPLLLSWRRQAMASNPRPSTPIPTV